MKKVITVILVAIAAVLVFWLVKSKQADYFKAQSVETVDTKFNKMDTNGDGLVSKEEFDAESQRVIAEKQITAPETMEKFNQFIIYTWENGDVNQDNNLTEEEFNTQRQRNREKFSRKK